MLKTLKCARCSIEFGVLYSLFEKRQEDGETFYCPEGHGNVFKPSEIERLKAKVTNLEIELRRAKETRDHYISLSSTRYEETKQLRKDLGVARRNLTVCRKKLDKSKEKE